MSIEVAVFRVVEYYKTKHVLHFSIYGLLLETFMLTLMPNMYSKAQEMAFLSGTVMVAYCYGSHRYVSFLCYSGPHDEYDSLVRNSDPNAPTAEGSDGRPLLAAFVPLSHSPKHLGRNSNLLFTDRAVSEDLNASIGRFIKDSIILHKKKKKSPFLNAVLRENPQMFPRLFTHIS